MSFLRYWQRNNKLFVLDNLGMPLTSKKNITFKKPETMISQQKLSSSFTFFLRYCKDIVNLLLRVLWPCLAMYTETDTVNLQETFGFIWRQKINFMLFRRCCKDMQTCFRYLGMPGYTQPNDSTKLQKTSMFICMPKIKFTIHFLLQIYFKETYNFIG